jgi:chromosome segregation ATPase
LRSAIILSSARGMLRETNITSADGYQYQAIIDLGANGGASRLLAVAVLDSENNLVYPLLEAPVLNLDGSGDPREFSLSNDATVRFDGRSVTVVSQDQESVLRRSDLNSKEVSIVDENKFELYVEAPFSRGGEALEKIFHTSESSNFAEDFMPLVIYLSQQQVEMQNDMDRPLEQWIEEYEQLLSQLDRAEHVGQTLTDIDSLREQLSADFPNIPQSSIAQVLEARIASLSNEQDDFSIRIDQLESTVETRQRQLENIQSRLESPRDELEQAQANVTNANTAVSSAEQRFENVLNSARLGAQESKRLEAEDVQEAVDQIEALQAEMRFGLNESEFNTVMEMLMANEAELAAKQDYIEGVQKQLYNSFKGLALGQARYMRAHGEAGDENDPYYSAAAIMQVNVSLRVLENAIRESDPDYEHFLTAEDLEQFLIRYPTVTDFASATIAERRDPNLFFHQDFEALRLAEPEVLVGSLETPVVQLGRALGSENSQNNSNNENQNSENSGNEGGNAVSNTFGSIANYAGDGQDYINEGAGDLDEYSTDFYAMLANNTIGEGALNQWASSETDILIGQEESHLKSKIRLDIVKFVATEMQEMANSDTVWDVMRNGVRLYAASDDFEDNNLMGDSWGNMTTGIADLQANSYLIEAGVDGVGFVAGAIDQAYGGRVLGDVVDVGKSAVELYQGLLSWGSDLSSGSHALTTMLVASGYGSLVGQGIAAVDLLEDLFDDPDEFFNELGDSLIDVVNDPEAFFEDIGNAAWNGIQDTWNQAGDFFEDAWDDVENFTENTWNEFLEDIGSRETVQLADLLGMETTRMRRELTPAIDNAAHFKSYLDRSIVSLQQHSEISENILNHLSNGEFDTIGGLMDHFTEYGSQIVAAEQALVREIIESENANDIFESFDELQGELRARDESFDVIATRALSEDDLNNSDLEAALTELHTAREQQHSTQETLNSISQQVEFLENREGELAYQVSSAEGSLISARNSLSDISVNLTEANELLQLLIETREDISELPRDYLDMLEMTSAEDWAESIRKQISQYETQLVDAYNEAWSNDEIDYQAVSLFAPDSDSLNDDLSIINVGGVIRYDSLPLGTVIQFEGHSSDLILEFQENPFQLGNGIEVSSQVIDGTLSLMFQIPESMQSLEMPQFILNMEQQSDPYVLTLSVSPANSDEFIAIREYEVDIANGAAVTSRDPREATSEELATMESLYQTLLPTITGVENISDALYTGVLTARAVLDHSVEARIQAELQLETANGVEQSIEELQDQETAITDRINYLANQIQLKKDEISQLQIDMGEKWAGYAVQVSYWNDNMPFTDMIRSHQHGTLHSTSVVEDAIGTMLSNTAEFEMMMSRLNGVAQADDFIQAGYDALSQNNELYKLQDDLRDENESWLGVFQDDSLSSYYVPALEKVYSIKQAILADDIDAMNIAYNSLVSFMDEHATEQPSEDAGGLSTFSSMFDRLEDFIDDTSVSMGWSDAENDFLTDLITAASDRPSDWGTISSDSIATNGVPPHWFALYELLAEQRLLFDQIDSQLGAARIMVQTYKAFNDLFIENAEDITGIDVDSVQEYTSYLGEDMPEEARAATEQWQNVQEEFAELNTQIFAQAELLTQLQQARTAAQNVSPVDEAQAANDAAIAAEIAAQAALDDVISELEDARQLLSDAQTEGEAVVIAARQSEQTDDVLHASDAIRGLQERIEQLLNDPSDLEATLTNFQAGADRIGFDVNQYLVANTIFETNENSSAAINLQLAEDINSDDIIGIEILPTESSENVSFSMIHTFNVAVLGRSVEIQNELPLWYNDEAGALWSPSGYYLTLDEMQNIRTASDGSSSNYEFVALVHYRDPEFGEVTIRQPIQVGVSPISAELTLRDLNESLTEGTLHHLGNFISFAEGAEGMEADDIAIIETQNFPRNSEGELLVTFTDANGQPIEPFYDDGSDLVGYRFSATDVQEGNFFIQASQEVIGGGEPLAGNLRVIAADADDDSGIDMMSIGRDEYLDYVSQGVIHEGPSATESTSLNYSFMIQPTIDSAMTVSINNVVLDDLMGATINQNEAAHVSINFSSRLDSNEEVQEVLIQVGESDVGDGFYLLQPVFADIFSVLSGAPINYEYVHLQISDEGFVMRLDSETGEMRHLSAYEAQLLFVGSADTTALHLLIAPRTLNDNGAVIELFNESGEPLDIDGNVTTSENALFPLQEIILNVEPEGPSTREVLLQAINELVDSQETYLQSLGDAADYGASIEFLETHANNMTDEEFPQEVNDGLDELATAITDYGAARLRLGESQGELNQSRMRIEELESKQADSKISLQVAEDYQDQVQIRMDQADEEVLIATQLKDDKLADFQENINLIKDVRGEVRSHRQETRDLKLSHKQDIKELAEKVSTLRDDIREARNDLFDQLTVRAEMRGELRTAREDVTSNLNKLNDVKLQLMNALSEEAAAEVLVTQRKEQLEVAKAERDALYDNLSELSHNNQQLATTLDEVILYESKLYKSQDIFLQVKGDMQAYATAYEEVHAVSTYVQMACGRSVLRSPDGSMSPQAQLRAEREALTTEVNAANDRYLLAQEALAIAEDNHTAKIQTTIHHLEEVRAHGVGLIMSREKVIDLKGQLDAHKEGIHSSREMIGELKALISSTKEQRAELKEALNQLTDERAAEFQDLRAQLDGLKEITSQSRFAYKETENELEAALINFSEIEAEFNAAQADVGEKQSALNDLAHQLGEAGTVDADLMLRFSQTWENASELQDDLLGQLLDVYAGEIDDVTGERNLEPEELLAAEVTARETIEQLFVDFLEGTSIDAQSSDELDDEVKSLIQGMDEEPKEVFTAEALSTLESSNDFSEYTEDKDEADALSNSGSSNDEGDDIVDLSDGDQTPTDQDDGNQNGIV